MTEYRRILIGGWETWATVEGDTLHTSDGRSIDASSAIHLPPVTPSKILAIHLNHRGRVDELMVSLPSAPTYFLKPVSALLGHRGEVVRPRGCKYLNFEGEIAIVMGRPCRGISTEEAQHYIRGFSIANDFGLHDFRDTDAGSMLRVKGSDTMCPVGPGLATDWDYRGKRIRTLVNGDVRQSANTNEMIWDMHYLVADLARTITLQPGDVILTGTPAGSRPVEPGDLVEVEVEGLGVLSTKVVDGPEGIPSDFGAQPTESEEVISTALGGDWEFRGIRRPRKEGP